MQTNQTNIVRNTIAVQINKHNFQALLDSGATTSALSAEMVARLKIPFTKLQPDETINVFVADGRSVDVLGRTELCVKINGLSMPCEFLVLPHLGHSVILGLDFLEANKAQVDFSNKVVTFFNNLTAANLSTSHIGRRSNLVRTLQVTILPPFSETMVPILLPSRHSSDQSLCEPLPITRGQKFVCARSAIDSSKPTAACKLLNPTNAVIWLPRYKALATLEPIYPDTLAVLADSQSPHTANMHSAPSPPNHSPEGAPLHVPSAKLPTTSLDDLGVSYKAENLSSAETSRLQALLEANINIFSTSISDLQATPYIQHSIHTDSSPPIRQRSYRHSPVAKKEIDSQIEQMLDANIIEPSCSMWTSPVVLVKKRNGQIRFCVDYRKLNSVTKPISFPLPQLTDIFDAMTEAKPQLFSLLDLRSGYHQIPMDPLTKEKSSFIIHSGQYQYLKMPFGLMNAPSTFQALMARVFQNMHFKSVLCYLDDILIYSKNFDEHLIHLQEVFQRLKDACLKLNPEKCRFGLSQILYLGHVLSPKGMEVDKSKIDVIDTYPRPTTQKEIRAFLGLAGYYRKFIQGFSIIANPLNRLLRKDMEFIWDDVCEAAFLKLKKALNSAPVLIYPDLQKPFILNCDACTVGIGYVISQEDSTGREHPICYGGRSLSPAERNYSITELECLALVSAVRQFNGFLANSSFTVYTDHLSLKYLQSLKTNTTGRLLRWSIALQGYNFQVAYKSGKANVNADVLSRRPYPPTLDETPDHDEQILASLAVPIDLNVIMDTDLVSPPDDDATLQDIANQQRQCPDIAPLIQYLEHGDLPANDKEARRIVLESSEYALDNGLLYHYYQPRSKGVSRCYINQLVVPTSLRQRIINGFHDDSSHPGFHRCYLSIRRKYFWRHMYADVQRHIASCQNCQQCKYPVNLAKAPLRPLEPKEIFGRWSMDILKLPRSTEGFNYILLCVENLTRWPEAIPLKDQSAQTIAQALFREVFSRYGPPKTLLSDRGPNFMSSIVTELSKLLGVKRLHTSAYRPQSNGATERVNRSILQCLRIHCKSQEQWADFIPAILYSFRAMTSQHLGHSPFYLMFGRDMVFPVDLQMALPEEELTTNDYVKRLTQTLESARQTAIDNTLDLQARNKKHYDVGTKTPTYKPGDRVWLFNPVVPRGQKPKLYRRFEGPYYITCRVAEHTFKLRNAATNKELRHPAHADRLKPYVDRRDFVAPTVDPATSAVAPDSQAPSGSTDPVTPFRDVDRLTGMKFINKRRFYRVLWKDAQYPPEWLPEADVSDCLKREFHIHRTMLGKPRKRDTPDRFKKTPTLPVAGTDD